jgi:hypothetical protein
MKIEFEFNINGEVKKHNVTFKPTEKVKGFKFSTDGNFIIVGESGLNLYEANLPIGGKPTTITILND